MLQRDENTTLIFNVWRKRENRLFHIKIDPGRLAAEEYWFSWLENTLRKSGVKGYTHADSPYKCADSGGNSVKSNRFGLERLVGLVFVFHSLECQVGGANTGEVLVLERSVIIMS